MDVINFKDISPEPLENLFGKNHFNTMSYIIDEHIGSYLEKRDNQEDDDFKVLESYIVEQSLSASAALKLIRRLEEQGSVFDDQKVVSILMRCLEELTIDTPLAHTIEGLSDTQKKALISSQRRMWDQSIKLDSPNELLKDLFYIRHYDKGVELTGYAHQTTRNRILGLSTRNENFWLLCEFLGIQEQLLTINTLAHFSGNMSEKSYGVPGLFSLRGNGLIKDINKIYHIIHENIIGSLQLIDIGNWLLIRRTFPAIMLFKAMMSGPLGAYVRDCNIELYDIESDPNEELRSSWVDALNESVNIQLRQQNTACLALLFLYTLFSLWEMVYGLVIVFMIFFEMIKLREETVDLKKENTDRFEQSIRLKRSVLLQSENVPIDQSVTEGLNLARDYRI